MKAKLPVSPKKSTKAQTAPVKHMERIAGISQGADVSATLTAPTTTGGKRTHMTAASSTAKVPRLDSPVPANKPLEEKRGRGRPSLPYDEKLHPRWAWSLAIIGKTEPQIAAAMGIGMTSLRKWEKEHAEFATAIKDTREAADSGVVVSLYKRACGYTAYEDKVTKDGDVVSCRVEIVPDVAACIFWLKNREAKTWRDKQDVNLSGHVDAGKPDLTKASETELKAALALVSKLTGKS